MLTTALEQFLPVHHAEVLEENSMSRRLSALQRLKSSHHRVQHACSSVLLSKRRQELWVGTHLRNPAGVCSTHINALRRQLSSNSPRQHVESSLCLFGSKMPSDELTLTTKLPCHGFLAPERRLGRSREVSQNGGTLLTTRTSMSSSSGTSSNRAVQDVCVLRSKGSPCISRAPRGKSSS